jgi:hypothetical protein
LPLWRRILQTCRLTRVLHKPNIPPKCRRLFPSPSGTLCHRRRPRAFETAVAASQTSPQFEDAPGSVGGCAESVTYEAPMLGP